MLKNLADQLPLVPRWKSKQHLELSWRVGDKPGATRNTQDPGHNLDSTGTPRACRSEHRKTNKMYIR